MSLTPAVVAAIVLYILKFLLGIWLSQAGRPYSVALVTVHKLSSVAVIVLLGIAVFRAGQAGELCPGKVTVFVLTGLVLLAALVSGGLVSGAKPAHAVPVWMHKIAPYVSVVLMALSVYLLVRK